ncbi:hypothetical protein [Dactylosporangium sp. NPDC048998]|uniref:hypothetical protein n=1 Tax=Dactylosporangium sp. NPDC048998 TaxID=3363976 RepID=UPI003717ED58
MSNVVKITSSPAQLIAAATVLTADGEALSAELTGLLGDIERLESDAVIGRDSFAEEFVKTYRRGDPTATDATKQAARSIATSATEFGDAVASTMQDYMVTDGQGAADIGSVHPA